MLRRIVQLSLQYRGVTVAIACLVGLYGIYIAEKTKLDVFPEFAPPQIVIQTEAPGLSAEEVESLVTRPVEYALNGTPELNTLYSQSIQGLSVVTAVFRGSADIYRVRQLTGERLTELAGQLPQGVESPKMGALTSSTSTTLVFGLASDERSPMELRTFADWTVRQRLLGVPGVARVETFGGDVRQLQIQVKPDRLVAYGISIDDVAAAARRATGVRGAGFVENRNQRIVIRSEGQSLSAAALGEAVLRHHGGVTVRLKDVADVVDGPAPKIGDAQVMGRPGVAMLVYSQFGANTLEVTQAVETALDELKPQFAASHINYYPALFRPANFIETSITNINHALLIGAALVVLVLFVALANLRSAFIVIATIPLSLLAAAIVLEHLGASINTITLGGFAISIGVVVDDAIIGLENVWRRLRENREKGAPRSAFAVTLDATLEVRSPVVYATFIVAAVFWPVLMMSGVNGRLFAPLGVAFILATLASLAVAITLTPALCHMLLPKARFGEPRYVAWLKTLHYRVLQQISRWPRTVIAVTVLVCLAAVAALPFFGGEFLPEFKEGHYVLRVLTAPGSSTQASLDIGTSITKALLKNLRIRSVSQDVGRAEAGEDTAGPEFSEFQLDLKPVSGEEEEQVQDEIRTTLGSFPGISFALTPFLEERMEEVLSGARGEMVINLFGNDLDLLDQKAEEVRRVVSSVPGAAEVLLQTGNGAPELTVSLQPERLKRYGFAPLDVLETIQTAYQGQVVTQTYDGSRVFDVVVALDPASRREPETIGDLPVRNAEGMRLPLRELADIKSDTGRYVIMHEGTRRRQQVTCNVEGRDVASFAAEVKARIHSEVALPPSVTMSYGGAAEAQKTAQRELLLNSAAAAVIIIILLSLVFENTRNMLLVLANVPFALAGGVLIAWLTGGSLSIGSLVGFISLFGISTRNSILMISHYEELIHDEGLTWSPETAFRGATERLLPILMTALVVALGLLPIALGSEEAGKEIEGPMAIVILGGLVTSTVLNLLVLPTLALRYGRFEERE